MLLDNVSIIIPTASNETRLGILLNDLECADAEIITSSGITRAKSMNSASSKATREYLWFLHADSRVSLDNLKALEMSLQENSESLRYFNLAFDGGFATNINAWGANIRSRVFSMPYGDQGICISKTLFDKIGGYREDVPYGEDLIFVLTAKNFGIKLQNIPSKLLTSSRKYKQQGWLKLTMIRQWQLLKLLRIKI